MRNIKKLVKVIMISGMVIVFNGFNGFNVIPSFASYNSKNIDDFCNNHMIFNNGVVSNINHYMSKVTVDDKGTTIIKYLDGSWYSYNSSTGEYKFKPIESNEELRFSSIGSIEDCKYEYDNIKNHNLMLSDKNSFLRGFSKHSDIIYTNSLKTNEDLNLYATKWLKDNYNLILDIPIYYSDISGNVGGYLTVTDGKPIDIKINKQAQSIDLLSEKLIIHELTHFALFKSNKEYHDETDSFTKECIKNGSNTSDGYVGFLQSHLQSTL